jgi:hypothetical protein
MIPLFLDLMKDIADRKMGGYDAVQRWKLATSDDPLAKYVDDFPWVRKCIDDPYGDPGGALFSFLHSKAHEHVRKQKGSRDRYERWFTFRGGYGSKKWVDTYHCMVTAGLYRAELKRMPKELKKDFRVASISRTHGWRIRSLRESCEELESLRKGNDHIGYHALVSLKERSTSDLLKQILKWETTPDRRNFVLKRWKQIIEDNRYYRAEGHGSRT